jgi:carboxyl-terminal processing protease
VQSRGGRTLYGGGGITPDLIVMADTLTTDEQQALTSIERQAGAINQAMFDLSVRLIQERPGLATDFTITDQDLDRLYGTLADSIRAEVPRDDFRRASRFIRYGLEREVALQKWGEAVEFQHRIPHDVQLQAALDLLERADSPEALLRLVARPRTEAPAAAAAAGRADGR